MLTVSALALAAATSGSAWAATGMTGATAIAAIASPATHTYGAIAVGVPDLNLPGAKRAGGVDVYFPNGRKQTVTEQKLGLVGGNKGDFDRFGAAVTVVKLNADEYPDLVVGAPGLAAKGAEGKVVLLFGSAAGITGKGAQVLSPGEVGDEFGAAIAVGGRNLYVGAPRHAEDRIAESGGLYRYSISTSGRATAIGLLTEANTGLGGTLQQNQRFGAVLAAATDGVVIGLPNKNVGSAIGAGEMIRYHATATSDFTAEIWTQNSPGVPGTAEAGDHFGAAITASGYAVGVPGEDRGTISNAGSVQTFQSDPKRVNYLVPSVVVSQADKSVPGSAEAGDRFGAALARGTFNCGEATSMAVGSPGEDIGPAKNAGSVTFVGLPVSADDLLCAAKQALSQGHGLPGRAETGDAVGTTLSSVVGDPELEENRFDTLLVGAPGEDIGATKAHRNTGRATISNNLHPLYAQSFGYLGGDLAGLGYGAVLATEAR